jgi:hypothetical protein
MLAVFVNAHGLVHCQFIPEGCTVNKEMYVSVCSGKEISGKAGAKQLISLALQYTW